MKTTAPGSTPLYRQVVEDIVAKIDAGHWRAGDKLPSERALCEHYGVSQITIRRALRELAHAGRVYSHHGLGWFIDEAPLAGDTLQDVTLVLSGLDWMLAPVVQALSQGLQRFGLRLRLTFASASEEPAAVAEAQEQGSRALLLAVTGAERRLAQRYRELTRDLTVPAVLLLRQVPGLSLPAVGLDEEACLGEMTRYLLDMGHRRLAYAGADPATVDGQRRYQGFSGALWERGLELPMDWVFAGPLSAEAARRRFVSALTGPLRPTAIVCASDTLAAEALQLLHELDLACPQDVAVTGMGDRDFAPLLSTPLTSYRLDLEPLGRAAAALVADLVAERTPKSATFTGQLVARQSCGAYLVERR